MCIRLRFSPGVLLATNALRTSSNETVLGMVIPLTKDKPVQMRTAGERPGIIR